MIDQKIITLLKVNETKNFTKASLELSLTQPAVSQHIKQLERDLDVKIFIRGDNELRLTKDGEIVIKYAQRIMAIYANLEQALIDEKKRTTHLTIGITHTSESNAIAEVLATFSSLHDNIRIKMVTDTLTNLYGMLKTYELDLAIVEGKIAEKGLNSLLLDTDCLVLAVSNNNRLAKLSMVTIADLKKEKMILRLPNSGTRNLFISHLESNNISIDDFNIILEVDNIATIKDLIRRDFGVSILAKSACMDEIKKGKIAVLPVENLSMMREINIVYHNDFEHINILQEIISIYNQTVKIYKT